MWGNTRRDSHSVSVHTLFILFHILAWVLLHCFHSFCAFFCVLVLSNWVALLFMCRKINFSSCFPENMPPTISCFPLRWMWCAVTCRATAFFLLFYDMLGANITRWSRYSTVEVRRVCACATTDYTLRRSWVHEFLSLHILYMWWALLILANLQICSLCLNVWL